MDKFKKITLSLFVIVTSVGYVVWQPQQVRSGLVQDVVLQTEDIDLKETTSVDTQDVIILKVPEEKRVAPTISDNGVKKQEISKPSTSSEKVIPKQTLPQPTLKLEPTPKPKATPKPTPIPKKQKQVAPAVLPKGKYSDGTYTSNPMNAYYGTVQVKTIVKQGKIVTVDFLQYPHNQSTSRMINGQAMPLLQKEVLTAQSEKVSGVSGATYTSRAFRKAMIDVVKQATG